MSNPWKLQLLTRWEEINSRTFTDRWLAIMHESPYSHVFFHPVLVNVWLETYRPLRNMQPLFVLASRGEQEVIFPLVLWKRNWKNAFLRVIVPVGHSDFDYHSPIFLHQPTAEQVQTFYEALKQVLDEKVDYDQIYLDGLHESFIPAFMQVVRQESCLSWSMEDTQIDEGFILPAKKSLRQDIKRRLRRLQEAGELTFYCHSMAEVKKTQTSIVKMLAMHKKRWPHAYKAPGLHQQLIIQGIQANLLDFIEMTYRGEPIAWQINFKFKNRYSQYMPAINDEYLKYSPGHLSAAFAFACAKKEGLCIVDHLRGAEGYKAAWGGSSDIIHDVIFSVKAWPSKLRIYLSDSIQRIGALVLHRSSASNTPTEPT